MMISDHHCPYLPINSPGSADSFYFTMGYHSHSCASRIHRYRVKRKYLCILDAQLSLLMYFKFAFFWSWRIISNGRFSIVGENRKNCSPRLLILTELWPAVARVQSWWLNKSHRELALSLETISEPVAFEGNTTEAHIEVFIFVSFASLLRAFIHKHDTTSRSARTQRCFTMGRRVVEIYWIIPWFSTKRHDDAS